MFSRLMQFIRQVIFRMVPYKSIETAERIESPLSQDMVRALDIWHDLYLDKAPWLKPTTVKSLNLPAFICSEIARQIILELKWDITGPAGPDGNIVENPRATFLKEEFSKVFRDLRGKLEQGCGAGGLTVKPIPADKHFYFDWATAWEFYPVAFTADGDLLDVIFWDFYRGNGYVYTRLERHTLVDGGVKITHRVFKTKNKDDLGVEVSLEEVPQWASLKPEAVVTTAEKQLFGWYRVAAANSVDINCPLGASVFARAVNTIKEADLQYSRLLWEFEGSELAVDVDVTALRPKTGEKGPDGRPRMELPALNERLFRGLDLGSDELYHVYSPAIRDTSITNGLNQIFARIEDQCGLARGTICDANTVVAKTATELRIVKQRSYATIADNQAALERCLRDVISAMDLYATIYGMAPPGEYQVNFVWDDSILTDTEQQMNERLALVSSGIMGKGEFREWYFSETAEQARAAIQAIRDEQMATASLEQMLPTARDEDEDEETPDDEDKDTPDDEDEDDPKGKEKPPAKKGKTPPKSK